MKSIYASHSFIVLCNNKVPERKNTCKICHESEDISRGSIELGSFVFN